MQKSECPSASPVGEADEAGGLNPSPFVFAALRRGSAVASGGRGGSPYPFPLPRRGEGGAAAGEGKTASSPFRRRLNTARRRLNMDGTDA